MYRGGGKIRYAQIVSAVIVIQKGLRHQYNFSFKSLPTLIPQLFTRAAAPVSVCFSGKCIAKLKPDTQWHNQKKLQVYKIALICFTIAPCPEAPKSKLTFWHILNKACNFKILLWKGKRLNFHRSESEWFGPQINGPGQKKAKQWYREVHIQHKWSWQCQQCWVTAHQMWGRCHVLSCPSPGWWGHRALPHCPPPCCPAGSSRAGCSTKVPRERAGTSPSPCIKNQINPQSVTKLPLAFSHWD